MWEVSLHAEVEGYAWYRTAIPLADERYEQHLANLQEQDEKEE